MAEKYIQQDISDRLNKRRDVRVFRNNIGLFYIGKVVREDRPTGSILLAQSRRVHCGLVVGSGDLIGWHSVVITPDMVGKKIARFVSVETKTPEGKASPEQQNWRDQVLAAGGAACFARSLEDAEKILIL